MRCADCRGPADGWAGSGPRRVPLCLDCLAYRTLHGHPRPHAWGYLLAGVITGAIALALWALAWVVLP